MTQAAASRIRRGADASEDPFQLVLDLVEDDAVLLSIARPASGLRAAVSRARGRCFRLMARAPEGLEERVAYCGLDPIAALHAANAGCKSVVGARPQRIFYQAATQGPIAATLSILEVETLDAIFSGLKRCSVVEIADCADLAGVAANATSLWSLKPLIVFDLGHLCDEARVAALRQLQAMPCLKLFSFFDFNGGILAERKSRDAAPGELFFAMCGYDWSAYLAGSALAFGSDVDLAAHARRARRQRIEERSLGRIGEDPPWPWSTRIEAAQLGDAGFYAVEGSFDRAYRATGPQSAARLAVWLPRRGRYRVSLRVIDWPPDRGAEAVRVMLDGDVLTTAQRWDGADLLVEADADASWADPRSPRLLTLVTKPESFAMIEGFRKGPRVRALTLEEIP